MCKGDVTLNSLDYTSFDYFAKFNYKLLCATEFQAQRNSLILMIVQYVIQSFICMFVLVDTYSIEMHINQAYLSTDTIIC